MKIATRTVATAMAVILATGACGRSPYGPDADRAREAAAAELERHKRSMMEILNDESKPASDRLGAARSLVHRFPESPEGLKAKSMLAMLRNSAAIEQQTHKRSTAEDLQQSLQNHDAGAQWNYFHNEDKMTGQVTSTAEISSKNRVSLDFPYAGEQRASLMLRKHPRYGGDVIFSIEKGQLLCRSYSGCPVQLRFDDDKPYTVQGQEPGDNSTEAIFLPGYKSIASRLGKSKKLLVEVGVYQNGSQIFEFDVAGFDQGKVSSSTK